MVLPSIDDWLYLNQQCMLANVRLHLNLHLFVSCVGNVHGTNVLFPRLFDDVVVTIAESLAEGIAKGAGMFFCDDCIGTCNGCGGTFCMI